MTTKQSIYKALKTFKRHAATATECYMYSHESDMLMISFDDKVTEFEVKVSKSDFYADFTKEGKHKKLTLGTLEDDTPNQFYYVCPDGMIDPDSVPEYAGLLYLKVYGTQKSIKEVKKAHELHNKPVPNHFWKELYLKQQARKKL